MKSKDLCCVLCSIRMNYKLHGLEHLVHITVIQVGQCISAMKIEVTRALSAQSREKSHLADIQEKAQRRGSI